MPSTDGGPRTAAAPPASLSLLVGRLEHRLRLAIEQALGEHGPNLDQWRTLDLLVDGAGHSMSEIAAFVMVPAPTLTKIVDRLVDAGLVYRRADDRDRRRILVYLSEHGRGLHGRLAPAVAGIERALTTELGPDAPQLLRLLYRLDER